MHNKILLDINTAEKLLETYDCSAHIKELKSGKYVRSNTSNLKVFGMNAPDDIIGLTLDDMNSFMAPYWGNNAREVTNFDQQVFKTEEIVNSEHRAWLNAQGHVWRHNMIKFPVRSNYTNKVSFVLTVSTSAKNKVTPLEMFELYKKYYAKIDTLIYHFLSHLNVLHYFNVNDLPTEAETIILLLIKNHLKQKQIADLREVNLRTIEKQLSSLKSKIKHPFTLETILTLIDNAYL